MVRSPLGLPLGDRGLSPLSDTLFGVGAVVVAKRPHTLPILKGCLYQDVQPDVRPQGPGTMKVSKIP